MDGDYIQVENVYIQISYKNRLKCVFLIAIENFYIWQLCRLDQHLFYFFLFSSRCYMCTTYDSFCRPATANWWPAIWFIPAPRAGGLLFIIVTEPTKYSICIRSWSWIVETAFTRTFITFCCRIRLLRFCSSFAYMRTYAKLQIV